jgi:hypothetical protein
MDILYMNSEFDITVTSDYSISGEVAVEKVECNNATPITVTLRAEPEDRDEVWVSAVNAAVTVDFNGKQTRDGCTSISLAADDTATMQYSEVTGYWRFV